MQEMRLNVIRQPGEAHIFELRDSLRRHNFSRIGEYPLAGERDFQSFLITHRSEQDELVGGLFAFIRFGWMVVDLLWVHESQRRRGLGGQLLQNIEHIGLQQGIKRYRLNTASFQTGLALYQRHGYEIFAELPSISMHDGKLTEFTDYYMKKEIG